jgi:NAD(P)-dependent dehydrogenase (short-subunit alcohol dehydrogenase family)
MTPDQKRVAMITGGNAGIGFAAVTRLAANGYHVIMASRNQQTSAQAIARLHASNPNASVESIPLDLASFVAVRQCAAEFQAKGLPLHILIKPRMCGTARIAADRSGSERIAAEPGGPAIPDGRA